MTGGLVSCANSSSKNILSSILNPKTFNNAITFFKSVYVRRAYISIQTTALNFDIYGNKVRTIEFPNKGDYISDIFIKIKNPFMCKNENNINDTINSNTLLVIKDFLSCNIKLYKIAKELTSCDNHIPLDIIINKIKSTYVIPNTINDFKIFLRDTPYKYDDVSVYQICCIKNLDRETLLLKIKIAVKILQSLYTQLISDNTESDTIQHYLPSKFIKTISLHIGNQEIVDYPGSWLNVHHKLFDKKSLRGAYNRMLNGDYIFIPINFWFCNGLASPLHVPDKQKIRLEVTFTKKFMDSQVLVDYVFIEKNGLCPKNKIIPIEQIEHQDYNLTSINNILVLDNFKKPSKELIWYNINTKINSCGIIYNDVQRCPVLNKTVYSYLFPYYYHTGESEDGDIFCYPFSLFPEETQISGSSNLRIINKISLQINVPQKLDNKENIVIVFSRAINYLIYKDGEYKLAFI